MKQFLLELLTTVLGEILAPFFSYRLGREKKENEQNKSELDNVAKAGAVRRRLKFDRDYAVRLRKKFTR